MNIVGIIPARMASSRFPGKPMVKIMGIPMIGHVYHRSKMCLLLDEVFVATCDKEIADYAENIGAKAIMTANTHERASDRTAEALLKVEDQTKKEIDYVIMIQGDEPMLIPEMFGDLINPIEVDEEFQVVNLMSKIKNDEEFQNPNNVKIVLDRNNNALYFSREPIPSKAKYSGEVPMWKQLGFILFKRDILLKYIKMEPTALEIIESVDMNRLLEQGIKIRMAQTNYETYAVDTKTDLDHVEELMKNDPLISKYLALVK